MVNTSTGRSFFQDPSMGVAQSLQGGGGGGGSYENMNQSMMQMSMPNVNMSTMMGNTTLMGGGQPMEGQPVPYELYRRLEIRVNRLEADLNNLKMALRSI